jgi:hypothetical protein
MSNSSTFTDPAYYQLEHGLDPDSAWVLSLLESRPHLFLNDPHCFLRIAEVLSRGEADFNDLPVLDSFELAEALRKTKKVGTNFSDSVKDLITNLLLEDCIQAPFYPFDFLEPERFPPIHDQPLADGQKRVLRAIFDQSTN